MKEMNVLKKFATNVGFAAMLLTGSVALADGPQQANCPTKAAEATVTCLGVVRGLMSPSPVDKALGAAAAPACLQQAYEASKCYAQQQAGSPGGRRP
jgi:hypothetical protein